jgi:uncharacterized iron-regulated protein
MAENLATFLQTENSKLVVFSGNGHIKNKFGIPDRARQRTSFRIATVVLQPVEGPMTLDKELADFVWLTGNYAQPRTIAPMKLKKK